MNRDFHSALGHAERLSGLGVGWGIVLGHQVLLERVEQFALAGLPQLRLRPRQRAVQHGQRPPAVVQFLGRQFMGRFEGVAAFGFVQLRRPDRQVRPAAAALEGLRGPTR